MLFQISRSLGTLLLLFGFSHFSHAKPGIDFEMIQNHLSILASANKTRPWVQVQNRETRRVCSYEFFTERALCKDDIYVKITCKNLTERVKGPKDFVEGEEETPIFQEKNQKPIYEGPLCSLGFIHGKRPKEVSVQDILVCNFSENDFKNWNEIRTLLNEEDGSLDLNLVLNGAEISLGLLVKHYSDSCVEMGLSGPGAKRRRIQLLSFSFENRAVLTLDK